MFNKLLKNSMNLTLFYIKQYNYFNKNILCIYFYIIQKISANIMK